LRIAPLSRQNFFFQNARFHFRNHSQQQQIRCASGKFCAIRKAVIAALEARLSFDSAHGR